MKFLPRLGLILRIMKYWDVKRSTVEHDKVWIKDFPHLKHCELLHTTHEHFGADSTQATVIFPDSLVWSREAANKVQLICADNDSARWPWQSARSASSMPNVASGSVQSSVSSSAALTLLAVLNLLVTRRSQCQPRVGVFFSSERFAWNSPAVCSGLAHWSVRIFSFTQELLGNQHWCYVLDDIKRKEFSAS